MEMQRLIQYSKSQLQNILILTSEIFTYGCSLSYIYHSKMLPATLPSTSNIAIVMRSVATQSHTQFMELNIPKHFPIFKSLYLIG
jgi:hypothetical protein